MREHNRIADILQATHPGPNIIKLFTAVIYDCLW
jgi:hypothetical protein